MAVHRLFRQTVFGPEDIEVIVAAYEHARDTLGISDPASSAATVLAKTVMRLAAEGPLEEERICARAISSVRAAHMPAALSA
ncbi:MAG TPA: hypothetical protein VNR11_22110 [Xanthobacteraceae bacterium]|nr:hypothetical protein [Xanthobacteraceae bacterium]